MLPPLCAFSCAGVLHELSLELLASGIVNEQLARELYAKLSRKFMCDYDETGSIGKRYRRADEAGIPFCICVDFDTAETGKVTVRDRDTMQQELVAVDDRVSWLEAKIDF